MADKVTLPGTGVDIASDDAGADGQVQIIKLAISADGVATVIPADAANGLDVDVTRLPSGTVAGASSLPAGTNNIGDVDIASAIPAGSNEIGGVNQTKVSGTAVSVNSGAKDAGTQRVILASDQTVVPISDNAGSLTVDGTVTANAGTGPWPVTDNGGSLTVDGTVAVSGTVAVTDNAGSLTVDAPVTTPVFVRLSDGTAAIATLPVSLASLPALAAGSAAIGKLTANGGVIIGDVNLVSAVPAGTNLIGQVTPTPGTAGGWSKIKYAAQTTTVVKPKASAGTFGGYFAYNPNASVAYIQVFDLATATTVTLGTTVPDMIFAIPAGAAANLEITCGVNMALGIQLACTTTAGGLTAPGTGLDLTIFFK